MTHGHDRVRDLLAGATGPRNCRAGAQSNAAKDLLIEAAELLDRAAGERHSGRNSEDSGRNSEDSGRNSEESPDDDNPEAQSRQLAVVEKHLAERGVGAVVNAAPLSEPRFNSPPDDRPLSTLADHDLLAIWGNVMRTLKDRGVVRSTNRPLVGDYAETLAAQALGAKRPEGRDRGVDLVAGKRSFQVKARLDPPGRRATHFDISNLDDHRFHVFVGFVFDEHVQVRDAWEVDWELLKDLAYPTSSKHRVKIRALEENYRAGGGVRQLEL